MRYHIFCGYQYHAVGGAKDYYRSVDDPELAKGIAKSLIGMRTEKYDYEGVEFANVFDSEECKMIFEVGNTYGNSILDKDYMFRNEGIK